jgi:hypothetical protein
MATTGTCTAPNARMQWARNVATQSGNKHYRYGLLRPSTYGYGKMWVYLHCNRMPIGRQA